MSAAMGRDAENAISRHLTRFPGRPAESGCPPRRLRPVAAVLAAEVVLRLIAKSVRAIALLV